MRATVVVFVVVAVAAMASSAVLQEQQKVTRVKRGYGGVRLQSQEDRIARLSAKIDELEELAEEKLGGDDGNHDAIHGLENRLDAALGGSCAAGDYQCGGSTRQCVSGLEVCDGVEDCANGHDEDEDTCHMIAETGSSFTGGAVNDLCTNRKPYSMKVVFTDSKTTDWFPTRPKVKATVILRSKTRSYNTVASLPSSGYYNYATRSIYLNPPESDRLGLDLEFVDSNTINAYVVRESTGEKCAQFVLFRD